MTKFVNLSGHHLKFEVCGCEYDVPDMAECEMPTRHAMSVPLHGIPLTPKADVEPSSVVAPAAQVQLIDEPPPPVAPPAAPEKKRK